MSKELEMAGLVEEVTAILNRVMLMDTLTLEVIKILSERVELLEKAQQRMSFEDLVDGKEAPQVGITDEQAQRLRVIQDQLDATMPESGT